jgi:hypothetical protein
MNPIPLKNEKLTTLLSSLTNLFYTEKVSEITKNQKEIVDSESSYHGTSDEYLHEAFGRPLKNYGFPRSSWGLGLTGRAFIQEEAKLFDPILKESLRLGKYLGVQRNALIMSYPDNGYIGWHHNGNAPGHNILFSYSQDGDGGFYYWDYELKKIVELKDKPGWNVKVGYYPSLIDEPNRVYWHMAKTKKQRVSIAFVIDHTLMWKNMIDDISKGDYDPVIIKR